MKNSVTQKFSINFDKNAIIPYEQAYDIVKNIHDAFGHPGDTCLINTIKRFIQIKFLNKITKDIRKKCQIYLIGKSNYAKLSGNLTRVIPL